MDIYMQSHTAGAVGHKTLAARQSYDPLNNQEIKIIMVWDKFTGKIALIDQFIKQEFSWHAYIFTISQVSNANACNLVS